MIAVITGDIVNSHKGDPKQWPIHLKSALTSAHALDFEIYRGDSFQIEIMPQDALFACLKVKAKIKCFKGLDVRMAIGLGEQDYKAPKVTESTGSAYTYSGQCFDSLKKNTLAIRSDQQEALDDPINLMLELAMLTANSWSSVSAEIFYHALQSRFESEESYSQELLAKSQNKTQSAISEGLKRSGFDQMIKLLNYYDHLIAKIC